VLEQLSEQVRECLAYAAEAKEKAEQTSDPTAQAGFLEMERRWRRLARSFEFTESLGDFTAAHEVRQRGIDAYRDSDKRNQTRGNEMYWLASIVASSDDAIISKDLDGVIMSWNRGAEQVFGFTAEEVIGKPITILIPPDRLDEEPRILQRIRAGEKIDHYETVRQGKDGRLIDISLSISPVRDDRGTIIGASKIARDITQRKQVERHADVLAHEAEHRTRNILANVSATVQLSHADTPENLKAAILGRIQALANVHALFVESRWTGAEFSRLVAQELAPYQTESKRVLIEGPQVMLNPNVAQALAVTTHELATNAAKYGALSGPVGTVQVTWSRIRDGELAIRWAEGAGPPVSPPARNSFGSRVMGRLIKEAGGTIAFEWCKDGLRCTIETPKP
jgi:PAS domain S-box-containing protein